jgi:hypothetical protein
MNVRFLTHAGLAAGLIVLGACTGQVTVQAQLEGEDGAVTPLRELEVMALPYDRDAIFDSLEAAWGTPAPQVPDSLVELQAAIATAQNEYTEATSRWGAARDSAKVLSDRLSGMSNRMSGEYRLMHRDFQDQEATYRQAEGVMNRAFERTKELRNRFTQSAQEYSTRREAWGEEAFVPVDSIIMVRLDQLGREVAADTTDANGIAVFALKTGQWWIHARYELPFDELYWNEPVTVARGEPTVVQLTRATAEVRPRY